MIISYIAGLLAITVSFSIEQEFIKQPKEKKFYPSCQQYTELNAEIVSMTNGLLAYCVELQKAAISEINGYVEGDKSCFINNATKKQRADAYTKKVKLKDKLQDVLNELSIFV